MGYAYERLGLVELLTKKVPSVNKPKALERRMGPGGNSASAYVRWEPSTGRPRSRRDIQASSLTSCIACGEVGEAGKG